MKRLLPLMVLVAACSPTIPTVERAAVVMPVYDPATSTLPTPNDLAMTDGKVAIEPRAELSDAEQELLRSFNGYDGFSAGSSPRVQFTAELAPESLTAANVLLFDLGEGGHAAPTPVTVDRQWSACDRSLSLVSAQGFARGHVYLAALRGGEHGARGVNGEPLVAPPAFYFLRAGKDLTQHPDALPGATREERAANAAALETVRRRIEPYFAVVASQGVPRSEVAALWTFTVHTTAEAFFDPGSQKVPFPNDLLRDPQTGLVSLPIDPLERAENQQLKRAFNQLDGFGMSSPITLDFTDPIDRATVGPATVRIFRADTFEEFTDLGRSLSADNQHLVLQPRTPLYPGTPYVVLVSGVTDQHVNALAGMPLTSLLKLSHPLVDADGNSRLSSLCADTAARLEPLRKRVRAVLEGTRGMGVDPAKVTAAWTFTTQDIVKRREWLWEAPYRLNAPLAVSKVELVNPPIVLGSISKIVTGQMMTPEFLERSTGAWRPNDKATFVPVEFFITLPKGMAAGASAPVVVVGHGMNVERRMSVWLANRLAAAGFATMAIDLPLHGERTVCRKDSDCESGATCAQDRSCLENGAPADLARTVNPWLVGKGMPTATGAAFIDTDYLPGARDHFRQALVDLSAQMRVLRGNDWRNLTGGYGLDKDKIYYVGVSLGSIIGTSFCASDPHVQATLLNVGGAGLVELMLESPTFGPTLRGAMTSKGIAEGSPEFVELTAALRWLLDEVDPWNLARYVRSEPLVYTDPDTGQVRTAPAKRLRVQMASADNVVPNSATERLRVALGADKDTEFKVIIGTHAVLADPVEPSNGAAQNDMVNFLESP